MARTSTTVEGMQRAVSSMSASVEGNMQSLNRVKNTIDVLRGSYLGVAASGYFVSLDTWSEHCTAIVTSLENMVHIMQGHAGLIQNTEDAAVESSSALQRQMAL